MKPHEGITPRRVRFQVATANQLGEPAVPSPSFSTVQWQDTTSPRQKKKLDHPDGDLQLTIRSEPVIQSVTEQKPQSDFSPLSTLPMGAQIDDISAASRSPRQKNYVQGSKISIPLVHRYPKKSKKMKSQTMSAQLQHYDRFFARSALLRREYDIGAIRSSEIPLLIVFSLLQGLKLPFDLLFGSLAICDAKLNGFPIKAQSHGFKLSSCGLQVGSCNFLNLPFSHQNATDMYNHNDGMYGRPFISTEQRDAEEQDTSFKANRKKNKGKSAKNQLVYAINFAQKMINPVESTKSMATRGKRSKQQTYLLASRIDFGEVARYFIAADHWKKSSHPENNQYLQAAPAASKEVMPAATNDGDVRFTTQISEDSNMVTIKRLALNNKQPISTMSRQPQTADQNLSMHHPCRTLDFLCLARLVTEMQKHFIVLKPTVRCIASPPLSSLQPTTQMPICSPHHILTSNHKPLWISSSLATKHDQANHINSPIKTAGKSKSKGKSKSNGSSNRNSHGNSESNNNKNDNAKGILSSFKHSTDTELDILNAYLAQHESFMAKARWGPNAQRVWICGVPVYDGCIAGCGGDDESGNNNGNTDADSNGKSDGGCRSENSHAHIDNGNLKDKDRERKQSKEQHEREPRQDKWWVLFLLGRRLAACVQYEEAERG